ncbi:MAG: hypothetical protein ACXAC5_11175 [Promethearchaeota archaeon]|jgi:hypothetical protein
MSDTQNEEILLVKAQDAENKCDWVNALTFYNQAAELYLNKDMVEEAAQTYKKLGFANIRAAFTADTADELMKSRSEIVKHFKKAEILFNQSNNQIGVIECKVGIFQTKLEFLTSLTEVTNAAEKTRDLLLQLIDFYKKKDDKENLAAAFAHLARLAYIPSTKLRMEMNEIYQKGIDYANESWKISKEMGNSKYLTDSLQGLRILRTFQVGFQEFRWDAHWKEVFRELLSKGNETLLNVEKKDEYHSLMKAYYDNGRLNCFYGFHFIEDEEKQKEFTEKGLSYLEKGLDIARKINDKFFIHELLTMIDFWALFGGKLDYFQKRWAADVSEMEELGNKFLGFLNFAFPVLFVSVLSTVARWSFFSPAQRIEFAEKGIKYGENFLKRFLGDKADYNEIYSGLTSLYSQLALLTPDTNKQDYFLQKMLDNANRAYELGQKAKGGFIRAYGYLAKYNAYKTLADLAKNENEKIKSLTIAVEAAKNHIVHTIESRTGMITAQLRTGLLLEELGILSQNNDVLRDCKEYFLKVINECIERGYKSYAANAYQYAARIEDRLGNHMSSAHNYEKSREIYEDSLKNIEYKPLINRIKEKMQYSLAWNLIENAKVNHKGENHLKAKEFYLKAFDILKSVARYNFEAPYYMAWALLEEAEQVSKQEQQKNAIEIYEKTINAFKNAIRSLEKANKQTNDERELVRINKLMKVAEIRINYCSARINLENARLLGRKGEHTTAADLFASAASKFRNICTRFKLERERKELEAIYFLCRAWESMEFAEKYEEHTRFAEAAALFSKASNLFSDTKMKFLSSANSAFCQALEFGCKFDQTLETEIKTELYPKVKVILSKASSLYEKGGFKSGADWAQATSIYFDAAWQLIKADEEIDLSKKGNLLKIGSEYLKSAIELFGKAGYKEKEIEVQDRLYRVEKEEKILLSALSTIQEPSISRSTIGIVAPTCPIETSESPRLGEIRQFSEEINQASNRVKREKEFKPTLIVEEEPIVLLILTTGGIPIFSYPFADEWKFDDELFGGFMSSFSSISDEIFSEGLDRAKFGSYTVLMESVSNFLICYLFKGQIFLAKQKLIKFVERIQDSTSIWQTLNKFQKTSQVVELRDIPVMESLLTEIFLVESS